MKHIDLIKLLQDNKDIIDRAYRNEELVSVDDALLDTTLFLKINKRYRLNKNYLNFADSILQRVDYSIIFGDYEKEYKQLVKSKNLYISSKDDYHKINIEKHIESLYEKFFNRDREIQILIARLESDRSLDIDMLLLEANNTLEKIYELIDANEKVGYFFRCDLRGLHYDIDELLRSISVDILKYIENISEYIEQINSFIVQTKKRRALNVKVMNLSNMLVNEDSSSLDEYLTLNHKNHYFTYKRSQKNRVYIYPDEYDIQKVSIKALKEILTLVSVTRVIKSSDIKEQSCEKLEIIDVDKIIEELRRAKSKDIFLSIKEHTELSAYEGKGLLEEAFKVYLHIGIKKEVRFTKEFNAYGIKVAKWV